MNIQPTKEAFLHLCERGNVVPVYADLMADFETPVSAYAKLKEAGPSYLFESIEGGENLERTDYTRIKGMIAGVTLWILSLVMAFIAHAGSK